MVSPKDEKYLFGELTRAYSTAVLRSLGYRKGTSYEFFLLAKDKTERRINELRADMKSHDALLALKKDFISFKLLYAANKRREKNRRGKKRKHDPRRYELRQINPDSVLLLIAQADLEQYNDFFLQHPTAVRIPIARLLRRKRIAKRLREETILDIYKSIYAANEIKMKIEESLLENPKELYPAARSMKRKFIIHSGTTNTGKTYNAISALKKAETGVYLGPLRLLAMEIQETLLMDNVMCNMKTGEEESIVPFATHVASTVEMVDLYSLYEVAVIDECQMIASHDRGCAWTRALLGVRAEEIHLCTAPDAVEIIIKIIEDCGDDYEIINYERRTPIEYDNSLETGAEIDWTYPDGRRRKPSCAERLGKIDLSKLEYGDALIAFSRADVLEIAETLKNKGIKASVVYGALPYYARKKQLRRFMNRETKVIVATDAIGMGLNLPIRRIIFTTAYKFDGERYGLLSPSAIKQIAGRAGRKGIYDKGYVYSVAEAEYIFSSLSAPYEPIKKAYIDFDTAFIDMKSGIRDIMHAWTIAEMPFEIYEKINVTRTLRLLAHVEKICSANGFKCDKGTEYALATVTFDEGEKSVFGTWTDYVKAYLSGEKELPYPRINRSSVEWLKE